MPIGGWDDPAKKPAPTVQPQLQPRPQYVYAQPATTHYLTCKVCDRGVLVPKKIFRLSTPVVVIGFILLIPSAIGMLISAFGLFGSFLATGAAATSASPSLHSKREAIANMQEAGVPRHVISDVLAGRNDKVDEWINADVDTNGRVTANEVEVVRQAQQDLKGSIPPLSIYGLMGTTLGLSSLVFGIASFVGGLFGWLLVMRKRVLQCQLCGAVVNAS